MPAAARDSGSGEFPPFAVTVDIAVFTIRDDALQVLLIKRGEEPDLGEWALPGGFVRPDENLDEAAERELKEETGVSPGSWHLEQLASYGHPERDPRMRTVTVAYWAICSDLPVPRSGGDAAHAALKPVEKIERGKLPLAFDHKRIVRDAAERTRAKLEYTALAARFCPPEFTISQLRRVFETVWNTRLDPGNFQRNVQNRAIFSVRAGFAASVGRGRPATLWSVVDAIGLAKPLKRPLARWNRGPDPEDEAPDRTGPARKPTGPSDARTPEEDTAE